MKQTKNLVIIGSSLWTRYLVKEHICECLHWNELPSPLLAFSHMFASHFDEPLPLPPKCKRNNRMPPLTIICYKCRITWKVTPREMCPNTEFFLVRIFSHSDWIRRDTPYLSVSSPNVGKYGPEKTPYLDTFHTVNKEKQEVKRVFN